ncbi:MAG: hypothetical protein U1F16_08220 [Turneriella sp.]
MRHSGKYDGTLVPDPVTVNGGSWVGGEMAGCHHAESKSFLDLLQADHNLKNEEVGRESSRAYSLTDGDKLPKQLGGDIPVPEAPAPAIKAAVGMPDSLLQKLYRLTKPALFRIVQSARTRSHCGDAHDHRSYAMRIQPTKTTHYFRPESFFAAA